MRRSGGREAASDLGGMVVRLGAALDAARSGALSK